MAQRRVRERAGNRAHHGETQSPVSGNGVDPRPGMAGRPVERIPAQLGAHPAAANAGATMNAVTTRDT